jgi:hypothetical protein
MYTPKNPHIPETPTKKLKLLTALSFGGMTVLAIAVISLSLLLITQHRNTEKKQVQIDSLSTVLEKSTDELTKTKRELIAQSLLPNVGTFSQQCSGTNEEDALFTPLSKTPIEGYNVFLVDCRSNLSSGKASPRVLVFRVNSDGTKEFTYGASSLEPLCISNKIPVANKLANKLSLPVCQTN